MNMEDLAEKITLFIENVENGPTKNGFLCFDDRAVNLNEIVSVNIEEIKNYPTTLFKKFLFYFNLKKYSFISKYKITFEIKNGYNFYLTDYVLDSKIQNIFMSNLSETLTNWYKDYSSTNFFDILDYKLLLTLANKIGDIVSYKIQLFPYDLITNCSFESLREFIYDVYRVDIKKEEKEYLISTKYDTIKFVPNEENSLMFEIYVSEMNRLKKKISPNYDER